MPLKLYSARAETSDNGVVSPASRWKYVLQLIRTSSPATKAQPQSIVDIFPIEILQNIVSFVNTPGAHAALCLTCKTFHLLAQPALLSDILIATRRDAVTYLRRCRQLANEPNGPTAVKRITFTWPDSAVASRGTYFDLSEVYRLPNLEEWIVDLPPRETIQCHGDKLYKKLISFGKNDEPDGLPVRTMYFDFGVRSTGELWKCPWLDRLLRSRKLQRVTIKHAVLEMVSESEESRTTEGDDLKEMNFFECEIWGPLVGSAFASFLGESLRVFRFCRRDEFYRPSPRRPRREVHSQWAYVRQCLHRAWRSLEVLEVSFGQNASTVQSEEDFTPFVALKKLTISTHLCSVRLPPVLKHAYYTVNGIRRELALVSERYDAENHAAGAQGAVRLKGADQLRIKYPNAEIVLFA